MRVRAYAKPTLSTRSFNFSLCFLGIAHLGYDAIFCTRYATENGLDSKFISSATMPIIP